MKNREYAQSLYQALGDDAFYIAMEASVDTRKVTQQEGMLRYLSYSMTEAATCGELVVSKNGTAGASIWSKPLDGTLERSRSEEKKAFIYKNMGAKSLETYLEIVDFMSAGSAPIIDDLSWYLSIVGIDPKFQGKGMGASLITPVLEKTDPLGVPTWLETFTPRNMSFYRGLGYKAVASFMEPLTQTEYWIMVREPQ